LYNPRLEIFNALLAFDRPVTSEQLFKRLPHLPQGTISSTLNFFEKEKFVVSEKGEGRSSLYRLVVKTLPVQFNKSRLNAPVQKGLTRGVRAKKPEAVLLMIPLPKNQSAVVTMEEAKRIYEALAPLFKAL
jgi:hypothetical protein